MYKILCLTTGDYIKSPEWYYNWNYKMPPEIQSELVIESIYGRSILEFKTEKAAKWFISHRLTYNPIRKDGVKLNMMENLFEANNIEGWKTGKMEFEVDTI